MSRHHPFDNVPELERRILRSLCGGATSSATWEALASQLVDHMWQEPEHRVVYEALRQIRSRDPKARREQLPAQATRMGFPDVEWTAYLSPETEAEIVPEQLIARLKAATVGRVRLP
jgi:hypothetical protein